MDALIAGRAGKAILLDKESLRLFDVDAARPPVLIQQSDLHFLIGDAQDLKVVENTDAASLAVMLEHEHNCACALDLVLISLDPDLSEGVRRESIEALEELLGEKGITERLENLLYGCPLPATADLSVALEYCQEDKVSAACDLFNELKEHRQAIREVYLAWQAIDLSNFDDDNQQAEFQQIAVQEGLFRALVLAQGNSQKINDFRLSSMLKPSLQSLRNYRHVLQQWVTPFIQHSSIQALRPENEEEGRRIPAERERRRGHKSYNRALVLENVERQKELIIKAMQRHDLARARNIINELIAYQMDKGGAEFVVKSLCDLAIEAKSLGNYSLQLELTERSIGLSPDDGWSWAQHGDALLNIQRATEALVAYENADLFGAGTVAKSGRAEVLKALGRLDEALDAYDAVIVEYPQNVIAKAGRAEVLKALGRLDEALDAYDAAIAEYPQNVIAKNGRAEVLKALGRLDEALDAYDAVIVEYPQNVIAKSGRAEVLKALGRLDEALDAYDAAIAEYPQDVIAKKGRAEALKALGRLDEALVAYDAVIVEYPQDVVAKAGRAEVLKALGRLDEALAAYDAAIAEYPQDVVAKAGRAEVLKALGRLDEALDAYDAAIAEYPQNVVARNGRSNILIALGRYAEALDSLPDEKPFTLEDWIGYHIRGMILLRMGKTNEAILVFEQGVSNENPWAYQKQYFRTSLAVASLKRRDFARAKQALAEVDAPILQGEVNVLRFHTFGELGEQELANIAYQNLLNRPQPKAEELVNEFHRRYILKKGPLHNDDWVSKQETELMPLAA